MKTKGRLSISRASCSDGRMYIRITVQENSSRIKFLDLEVSLEKFAEAVTGLGHQECSLELLGLDLVGKHLETKTELVPRPTNWRDDNGEAKQLLAPFEVEGWRGDRSDLYNHHHWVGQDKVSVVFRRHVEIGENNV